VIIGVFRIHLFNAKNGTCKLKTISLLTFNVDSFARQEVNITQKVASFESFQKIDEQSVLNVNSKQCINFADVFGAKSFASLKMDDFATVSLNLKKKNRFKILFESV